MRFLALLICSLSIFSCSAKEPENIPGRGGYSGGVKQITPTTTLGAEAEDISRIKLTQGKLINITQVTPAVCARAFAVGSYLDIITSDRFVFGISDTELEKLFIDAAAAIKTSGVKIWGMHLPYNCDDSAIQIKDETKRAKAVANQIKMMELSIKYFKPNHFVIHPGSTNIYTSDSDYSAAMSRSQLSLVAIQEALDGLNSKYGTNAILCVENCPRNIAYDVTSLLALLNYKGLEKVRICLDTGHALIPFNGEYRDGSDDKAKSGDAVQMLRQIGTRLGTLHIQQNHGAETKTNPKDEHIEPWEGGLIDWGEFYEVLLKDCRYRGCFLYETSNIGVYNSAESSSIESGAKNYNEVVYAAFTKRIKK